MNHDATAPACSGRLLAIGDVHGCASALRLLIEQLQLTPEDTLVFVGDLVDKGPDTRSVLEQVLGLTCRVVVVMGNHDQALLEALDRRAAGVREWEGVEQFQTFRSYGGVEQIPPAHIALLRSAVPYYAAEGQIFVHANLEPGAPLEEQDRGWLQMRYLRGNERPHPAGQRVICGHTIQNSGVPWVLDGWVCIDTGAFHGGWLTCLDVRTDHLLQTSENGTSRRSTLAELGRVEPKHSPSAPSDPEPSAAARPVQQSDPVVVALLLTAFGLIVLGGLLFWLP